MNQAHRHLPMQRAMMAVSAFFGEQDRYFNREWHRNELSRGDTRLSEYAEWLVHQLESEHGSVDHAIRVAMETIHINVTQLSKELDDEEDEGVAGVYTVQYGKDISGTTRAKRAAIALDIFHASVAIGCLDDFEILAVDAAGHFIAQAEDHEDGSCHDYGTVEKIEGDAFEVRPWAPRLYIEAFTNSGFANVGWASIGLKPKFLEQLAAVQEVCALHELASAALHLFPDAWDNADQWRPDAQRLHVSRDDFWFTASPKNHDSEVETRAVPLGALREMLADPARPIEDRSFAWRDGALYYHGAAATELIDMVNDHPDSDA